MSSPACDMCAPARSWMSYLELTKPRLSSLVLFTTLVGFVAGTNGPIDGLVLLHLLVGTMLVAGGANALNQVVEREFDAQMQRTRCRPLPSGRLTPVEALRFAAVISIVGLVELLVGVNLIAAFFGALALGL